MTDATAPGQPYLIHSFEHRAYPIPADRPISIGRDTACDITVNEVAVSRHHAEVRQEGDSFVLYPVGSTSTVMNAMPLAAPQPLHEGDTFLIGTMKFMFTRERLPVAMRIAGPPDRMSSVDDRRPTLTFPAQPTAPEIVQPASSRGPLIVMIVAIVIVAAVAYWMLMGR
ncbi:MAG TPA: FHA domain-containing protein [Candidatus Elarobacter sp.]|nr:FHA domain-containing protein [Candidatus Elarobacter sp.]